jgi:hypothetical protein
VLIVFQIEINARSVRDLLLLNSINGLAAAQTMTRIVAMQGNRFLLVHAHR